MHRSIAEILTYGIRPCGDGRTASTQEQSHWVSGPVQQPTGGKPELPVSPVDRVQMMQVPKSVGHRDRTSLPGRAVAVFNAGKNASVRPG